MHRYRDLTAKQKTDICEQYTSGTSLHGIAAEFSTTYSAVRTVLTHENVPFRKPHVTLSRKGPSLRGADNPSWTGSNATYNAKHLRVKGARGVATGPCGHCGTLKAAFRFEWAQIHATSGTSPEDYISLCRVCHEEYDAEKLNTAQVQEIKALAYLGVTQSALARMYSVNASYVSMIVRGRRRNAPVAACDRG